ncbi:hypothetical protein [Bradyrhizobium sp. Ash2021]|uniref:hypothetical protein n=1 Tax=Bradyrhizobium sp. Ash2021 TaxID=2954771 RepID=UPI002814D577|nr:hypothetical protein [Bradyrhizobium sp. Ash2021]WMT71082.1 hypothetical protein NL528_23545 [Bradyrhizobium sp. Ash2021]
MPKAPYKIFSISWGNGGEVCVELSVSKAQWDRIVRGDTISIKGEGYGYDGDWFKDIWNFSGGLDGNLEVCYGQPSIGDYSGQGFVGAPRDALTD